MRVTYPTPSKLDLEISGIFAYVSHEDFEIYLKEKSIDKKNAMEAQLKVNIQKSKNAYFEQKKLIEQQKARKFAKKQKYLEKRKQKGLICP